MVLRGSFPKIEPSKYPLHGGKRTYSMSIGRRSRVLINLFYYISERHHKEWQQMSSYFSFLTSTISFLLASLSNLFIYFPMKIYHKYLRALLTILLHQNKIFYFISCVKHYAIWRVPLLSKITLLLTLFSITGISKSKWFEILL